MSFPRFKNHFVLITALCAAMLMAMPSALAGNYENGVTAYKKKSYATAMKYLIAASKENPNNAQSIFYLGMAQVKTGQLQDARASFERVTHMLPANDPLAAKARNNISFIAQNQIANASNSGKALAIVQKSHSRTSKPNYLTHVLFNGHVVHFDLAKMPLKVYVESGHDISGWTNEHNNVVTNAMQTWQSANRGRIRFTRVNTPSSADIVVRWQKNFSHNKLGVSPFQATKTGIILQSDVNLAVYYPDSDVPMSTSDLTSTAIHEFGHALGMKGHSPYPGDVMYFAKNEKNSSSLTARDINTMQMLYSTDADVQNASGMSTADSKRYFDFLNKGLQAEKAGQLSQAMTHYRSAMNISSRQYEAKYALAILVHNQGVQYTQQNNIAMAKRNFQDAVDLLKQVVVTPGAPGESKQVLATAEKNLAMTKGQ